MDRIGINDLLMGSYITALKAQGYNDAADRVKKTYEGKRAEIVANTKPENRKDEV